MSSVAHATVPPALVSTWASGRTLSDASRGAHGFSRRSFARAARLALVYVASTSEESRDSEASVAKIRVQWSIIREGSVALAFVPLYLRRKQMPSMSTSTAWLQAGCPRGTNLRGRARATCPPWATPAGGVRLEHLEYKPKHRAPPVEPAGITGRSRPPGQGRCSSCGRSIR